MSSSSFLAVATRFLRLVRVLGRLRIFSSLVRGLGGGDGVGSEVSLGPTRDSRTVAVLAPEAPSVAVVAPEAPSVAVVAPELPTYSVLDSTYHCNRAYVRIVDALNLRMT